jgi:hypothetical protein
VKNSFGNFFNISTISSDLIQDCCKKVSNSSFVFVHLYQKLSLLISVIKSPIFSTLPSLSNLISVGVKFVGFVQLK